MFASAEERAADVGPPEGDRWEPVGEPRRVHEEARAAFELQMYARDFRVAVSGELVKGREICERIARDPGELVEADSHALTAYRVPHGGPDFGLVWLEPGGFHRISGGCEPMPGSGWARAAAAQARRLKSEPVAPPELWNVLEAATSEHGFDWGDAETAFGDGPCRAAINTAAVFRILDHVAALPVRERGRFYAAVAGGGLLADFDRGDLSGGLVEQVFADVVARAVTAAETVDDLAALVAALTVSA